MAMPQCCYLAKGAKRQSHTTNTIKFDRIPFDPCNSIKRFDLYPFDQKNSTYLQPPEKTFSEAVNTNDPGPKTFSAHVLQTQRLDTVFNDNSLVSSSKPVRKKREVKIGTGEIETFKGVEKPPP